jgi:type I restriction enzyme M protein
MRKSLGNKRNELTDHHIADIGSFAESENSKIFDNDDFGYRKITVERPLRLSFSATPEHLAALRLRGLLKESRPRASRARKGRRRLNKGRRCRP